MVNICSLILVVSIKPSLFSSAFSQVTSTIILNFASLLTSLGVRVFIYNLPTFDTSPSVAVSGPKE